MSLPASIAPSLQRHPLVAPAVAGALGHQLFRLGRRGDAAFTLSAPGPAIRPARLAVVASTAPRATALFDDERAAVRDATPARVVEFTTGRWCARRALGRLGISVTSIPVGALGAPVWPDEVRGSISHADGIVCTFAGTGVHAIGVDVERLDRPVAAGVWRRILCDDEGHFDSVERLVAFSAKEAFFKMTCADVGHRFGFHSASITLHGSGRGFSVRLRQALSRRLHAGSVFVGNYVLWGAFVVSWIVQ